MEGQAAAPKHSRTSPCGGGSDRMFLTWPHGVASHRWACIKCSLYLAVLRHRRQVTCSTASAKRAPSRRSSSLLLGQPLTAWATCWSVTTPTGVQLRELPLQRRRLVWRAFWLKLVPVGQQSTIVPGNGVGPE
jgi:hypothetical protein